MAKSFALFFTLPYRFPANRFNRNTLGCINFFHKFVAFKVNIK